MIIKVYINYDGYPDEEGIAQHAYLECDDYAKNLLPDEVIKGATILNVERRGNYSSNLVLSLLLSPDGQKKFCTCEAAGLLSRCQMTPLTSGYDQCTRAFGHDGPCAHEFK